MQLVPCTFVLALLLALPSRSPQTVRQGVAEILLGPEDAIHPAAAFQQQIGPFRDRQSRGALGLLPEELASGVGPKLLHHIKQGIKANLLSPLVRSVAKGAVLRRIVDVRNTSGDCVSSQL